MKAVSIVLLGLLAIVGVATRIGEAHSKQGVAANPATSTLESMVRHGTNTDLVVREADSTIASVELSVNASIATQNQGQISADDLRAGDRLVVQRNRNIQDVSQRTVDLSGVVATAPVSNNSVMTVEITPSRSVLVDVAPQTHFTDVTQGQTEASDVVDSDTVSVRGVLDTTLDEVVVAQQIERLGPKLTLSYTSTSG